ncbi:hypothetical protein Tel_13630 [Candidatus Tenderia electrophaga]|jgi:glycosyltransferase involved in cell wall biosynthesis|uniref:Glycosyl transferase family 1 n=1 Tax=Candidatus Tenderia electrophaga TaxID=1748243 RepID=A0A0S2TG17_9GAMM|nr:hypothetical protein Tel_13630 [Candidatus Tenderia electrophaga]
MNNSAEKIIVCFTANSAFEWGGASRVLFTNLRLLDRSKFEPIVLLPYRGRIIPTLESLGIRYEVWGKLHEPQGILEYLKTLYRFIRFLKQNKVRILHINGVYWRPAEVLAAKLAGVPIVTHYHVLPKEPGPFVKYSSLIVAVSEYISKHALPPGVPKRVLHNAVEPEKFTQGISIRGELGIDTDKVVVSFIGQIKKIKGVDLFIAMAKRLQHDDVVFIIAGKCRKPADEGNAYTEEALRAEIGDTPNIHYVGFREDIPNIYASSDMIVVPSRWEEPFGLILLEAGAVSKPVVAAQVGGIPEVVVHGETGYLFPKEDLDTMTLQVETLVSDAALRTRMGAQAREHIERHFTHQPVRALEQTYLDLLDQK